MPEEEKTKKPITDEIATASKDLDIFAGWIKRLENPDPTLRSEAGGKGLKLYDEVDRDPHAGSVLQTRYLAVVGKDWDVIPADSARGRGRPAATTKEQHIADFVKETLKKTNFEQSMAELLQAILYGFYVSEVIWKIKDGNIRISKIRSKHPRRFSFTQDRELRLLTPQNMIEGEVLPDRKFIEFTYGSSDNPYGKGLGQKLWWPVWFKKHGIKFWLIFLEKFGMPTAVGKYPPGTDPEQQQALLDAIDAIQNETGVKIPDTMALDLLEASRNGKVTYETLCEYMDKQISKAVLGQTATTEGTPGKLGNENAQEEVRQDILEADASLLCETLNESLIPWIVDFNFPTVVDYPMFVIRTEQEEDLKPLAERDDILVTKIGLDIGEKYFYDTFGIPVPEEGEKLVRPSGRQSIAPTSGQPEFTEGLKKNSELSRAVKAQKQLDMMADQAIEQAVPLFETFAGVVSGYLEKAGSFEEARDGITNLVDQMDTRPLAGLLAAKLVAADRLGVSSVGQNSEFAETFWGPGQPFEEAIDFFNAKALTISGVGRADVLAAVKDEIVKAMESGETLQAFKKSAGRIFEKNGYTDISSRQIDTIFRTNMQGAYQAGRHRQMTDPAVIAARPYWRYVAVLDAATRPTHAAMHGKVFRHDHPFWQTWFPPNGFN